ncbi:MAG: hypothetical protein DHS20C01_38020 [marine bacterium B5-7]|nr:MAG: hypothetical protein DHS20C01_38020 [marine bacterium B5-7]
MLRNSILLFAVSLAWASEYQFISEADRALPPTTVAACTTLVAALVMLFIVGVVMHRPIASTFRARPEVPLVMAVIAVVVPKLSVVIAEDSITADLASLVGTTVPVLTFLITVFITRQAEYSHLRMAGVFAAFLGMLIFVGIDDLAAHKNEITGALIMMSGGVAFAINGIFSSLRAQDLDQYALTTLVLVFGGTGLGVAALLVDGLPPEVPDIEVLASITGSGVLAMGLAYLGYYLLIADSSAYFASFYAYLVPPLGLLTGVFFLDESPTINHILGVGVTLLGLWLLTRSAPGKKTAREDFM